MGFALIAFTIIVMVGGAILAYKYYRNYQKERMRESVRDILATYIPLNDIDGDIIGETSLNAPLTEI